MAIFKKGKYYCSICGKDYTDPFKADECRDSHEVIYIPLTSEELNRLLQFIWLAPHDDKTQKLLSKSLIDKLSRYLRGN